MTPDTSDDEEEAGDDIRMRTVFPSAHKVLIHCADGYTESTLLGLAYFMYAEAVPLHEAWLRLHCEKKRNFFAYPSDVSLLASLQPLLLRSSGCGKKKHLRAALDRPSWLSRMDGSLPSRVLPYMYLGNIGHANNPDLLKAMGITQVLSVGEPVKWPKGQREKWGVKNMLFIDRVQDNGVDPLMDEFERCLEFIGKAPLTPCTF
jgi:dual specificity MAP kinase phosphatase